MKQTSAENHVGKLTGRLSDYLRNLTMEHCFATLKTHLFSFLSFLLAAKPSVIAPPLVAVPLPSVGHWKRAFPCIDSGLRCCLPR